MGTLVNVRSKSGEWAVLLAMSFFVQACGPEEHEGTTVGSEHNEPAVSVPLFNADSAYAFVARQVAFGPRVPGTPAHDACATWMVAKLRGFGADTVIVQTGTVKVFNGKQMPLRNIIAGWHPERKERVLLMAHYDTRPFADKDKDPRRAVEPFDGANDGGSGVGILMEIARNLDHAGPANVGIDIFLTDVEDYGEPNSGMTREGGSADTWCLGSRYWAKNPHVPGYKARYAILLDMCGARDAKFYKEAFSMQFAGHVVGKVWKSAAAVGYGDRFVNDVKYFVGIDDHVVVHQELGIPAIDIIQYDPTTEGFHPSWHTHDDNMDVIDAATLRAVGQTLMEVVWKER